MLTWVGSFLLGTLVGIPMTYVLSCVFVGTGEPILWGTLAATALMFTFGKNKKSTKKTVFIFFDVAMVIGALVFSTWLMIKTLHGDSMGQIFVGSNNVFDFGHMIGLMRSMSWGDNVPVAMPFFAGMPMLYHFFFVFWAALWEHFGVPVVWAINIPSVVSFAAMLVIIYYVPQIIAKQKWYVGCLAALFTITNSSLTFWHVIGKKDIWLLPTYPFAGPFDGSTISIFVTLNNYVNQRHLAFSIAIALFLFLVTIKKKTSVIIGILTGFLIGWNMVMYVFVIVVISGFFVTQRKWKQLGLYVSISSATGFLFLLPIAGLLYKTLFFLQKLAAPSAPLAQWNITDYLWQNLGILPLVAGAGFLVLPKRIRVFFSPFVACFLLLCIYAAVGKRGFEQKSYSFFIIGINVLAAIGITRMWQTFRVAAMSIIFVLTISGIVDLIPIKNEFAFPLVGQDTVPLMTWITQKTPKNTIFISYEDMIDPVVLAGRKNYYGFFKNIGQYDRSSDVRQIYAGDIALAKAKNISYILVPKWEKSDFPYKIKLDMLPIAYEDARFRVFRVE